LEAVTGKWLQASLLQLSIGKEGNNAAQNSQRR
jgi:hypothetical protein